MSETVETTAAPSTAEIAADVFESFESGDAGESAGASETEAATEASTTSAETAATETPEQATATPGGELDDEVKALLAEFGYESAKNQSGFHHRIPYPRVLRMIGDGLKRGRDKWTGEKTTLSSERDSFKEKVDILSPLYGLMQEDPRAFLELVSKHDERYKPFLTPAQAEAAREIVADLAFPEGDLPLADGNKTFSPKGIEERLVPFLVAKIRKELDAKVDEKLKPWEERDKEAKARVESEKAQAVVRERATKAMTEAQTWPLFGSLAADGSLSPFQQDVLDALKADKTIDLRGAYMKVALPRLTEDDTKKRERLLKEINGAPKATAVARSGNETPAKAKPQSTTDIARSVLHDLETRK